MRLPVLAATLTLAISAGAQESEPTPPPPPPHEPFTKGSFTIDAMTTSGRHMGFGFYLSDRVSIRPALGFGLSGFGGSFYTVGADLRVETHPANRWSFYGVATGSYRGGEDFRLRTSGGQSIYASQGALYGVGVGVRRRVHDRLMFVLDTRYLRSSEQNPSTIQTSLGQLGDKRNHFVTSFGLSFALN